MRTHSNFRQRAAAVGILIALPLALVACNKAGEAAKGPDGKMTEAGVREELAQARHLKPGNYASSFAITKYEVPGIPAAQAKMVQDMMASAAAVEQQHCLTAAESERGSQDMFRELARANGQCSFDHFDVTGDNLTAQMTCGGKQPGQAKSVMTMRGTLTDTSSDMVMSGDMTDSHLPQGRASLEMHVQMHRTRDCTPAEEQSATAAAAARAAQGANGPMVSTPPSPSAPPAQ